MHHVKKLQEALGYKHRLYFVETVIMTNLDMEEVSSAPDLRPEAAAAGVTRRNKPRYVTARVTLDAETPPLFVTSCHLHYRAEPTRLAELAVMEADLGELFRDEAACQVKVSIKAATSHLETRTLTSLMPGVGRGLQQPHAGGLHGGRLGGDRAGAAAEQLGAAQDRRGREDEGARLRGQLGQRGQAGQRRHVQVTPQQYTWHCDT